MRISDKAIVLQAVKHGDRQFIVKLYTRGHGLVTLIASAGKSPASKIRAACLMPLSLVEVNYIQRQNREINRLSEIRSYYVHDNLSGSLAKLSIAQFMNEVLIKVLKEQQSHPELYDFLEGCFNYLNDSGRDYTNLHLYFLKEMSRHLGFEPHNNYSHAAPFFDCREGAFSPVSLPFPLGLGADDSLHFSEMLAKNPLREKISYTQRQWMLEIWLAYYQLHLPNFSEIKSLEVLREVGRQ